MTPRDAITVSVLGILFSLGHVYFTILAVRAAGTRDDRLEAMGLLVRGLPGLFLAASVALRSRPIASLTCLIISIPTLVLGRAVYELIVFHPSKKG